MPRPVVLLGPQRPNPNLLEALNARVPGDGHLVAVTAGWRHDEGEDLALREHVGVRTVHLPLYRWFDELTASAPELVAAWRARQDKLRSLKRVYRMRLGHALEALFGVERAADDEDPAAVAPQRAFALEALRNVDAQLLAHADELRSADPELNHTWLHKAVAPYHAEVQTALSDARALLLAGGHVGVLLNRLKFFGVPEALADHPDVGVVAWSAGLMAITQQIVLFYDDAPDGEAWPEVFDTGLGMVGGLVTLPHAKRRLRLEDTARVSLLAWRFAPEAAIGLENGAWIERRRSGWVNCGRPGTAFRLCPDGQLRALKAAT